MSRLPNQSDWQLLWKPRHASGRALKKHCLVSNDSNQQRHRRELIHKDRQSALWTSEVDEGSGAWKREYVGSWHRENEEEIRRRPGNRVDTATHPAGRNPAVILVPAQFRATPKLRDLNNPGWRIAPALDCFSTRYKQDLQREKAYLKWKDILKRLSQSQTDFVIT